jgi:hypothetical protein
MKAKPTFWQRIGLHDWFLKSATTAAPAQGFTPEAVYKYIIQQFQQSIKQLSFANRIVFFHEYIIAFNTEDYRDFMEDKKGIFGLIVQETVKQFYELLSGFRASGKTVAPSASKWVFRFVSHPDYARGDLGFIGKLLPGNSGKEENLRVTFIPRQTGIAQTFDINPDILKGFNFYSEGYYEVPYGEALQYNENAVTAAAGFARFETILPDKAFQGRKLEYLMKDDEIIISGNDETREASHIFRVPSEWVNTPHLRIKYSRNDGHFQVASFGEKTILNEKQLSRSDVANPSWTELPLNSKLMLNGIVGINIFKP